MKNKLLFGLLTLILVLSAFGSISVSAERYDAADKAQSFIGGIVASKQSDGNIQSLISGEFSQNAGNGSEWYVLALSQYGDYDFTAYQNRLLSYLAQNEVSSASSRLKFALCLSAVGSTDEYIAKTAGEAIGKQGIMSYVFGLHLLNNVGIDDTKTEVIRTILSMQKSDGGWCVMGNYGDNDVTAMTLQALAPYYQTNAGVKAAVDKALALLSKRQKADGDYAGYGVDNPESTAQVLVTLSSLGIDCTSDSRFIKNGNTVIDGIEKYRLSDGTFCHQIGGGSNENATTQVFYAMVSYIRFRQGKTPLYILDRAKPVKIEKPTTRVPETTQSANTQKPPVSKPTESKTAATPPIEDVTRPISPTSNASQPTQTAPNKPTADAAESSTQESRSSSAETTPSTSASSTSAETVGRTMSTENTPSAPKAPGYKPWAILVIVGLGGIAAIVLLILKKKSYKNFVAILALVALAVTVVCVTDFRSADEYYNGESVTKENVIGHVTMTIRCDTVVGKDDAEHIPDNGIILAVTDFEIQDGDTVYDVLIEAARKYKIQVENTGNDKMAYIAGIHYLYEFDYGDLSGWVYHVNGEAPSVGCGEYTLADGDQIEWHYTCDLGNDVK